MSISFGLHDHLTEGWANYWACSKLHLMLPVPSAGVELLDVFADGQKKPPIRLRTAMIIHIARSVDSGKKA